MSLSSTLLLAWWWSLLSCGGHVTRSRTWIVRLRGEKMWPKNKRFLIIGKLELNCKIMKSLRHWLSIVLFNWFFFFFWCWKVPWCFHSLSVVEGIYMQLWWHVFVCAYVGMCVCDSLIACEYMASQIGAVECENTRDFWWKSEITSGHQMKH